MGGRVTKVIRLFLCKEGGKMAQIVIDASDLQMKIARLQANMKPQQFTNAMHGIFNRTGSHVKTILRKDLPIHYYAKAGDISATVKRAQVTGGGLSAGCIIPIQDRRGSVGGRYSASGGAHGWQSLKRKYRVKARVVKAGASTLPANLPGSYGGNPPFRNFSAPGLNGVAFTRKTKDRFPIMKVESMAIPQMPQHRAEPDVQHDIKTYLERQMDQRFRALIMNGL